MKLSTKGRYGLKAMYELAVVFEENTPMTIKTIAEKIEVSELYLEQIFSVLKKNKLVNSIRGAQGGYLLSRTPESITVGDIIRSLEGPIAPSSCVGDNESCSNAEDCVTKIVWEKMKNSINDCIDSISLQDMLDKKI